MKHQEIKGYQEIHRWIRKEHGSPVACEMCKIKGKKNNGRWTIMWALRKGKQYARDVSSFMGLCSPCHRVYDDTPEWHARISAAAKLRPHGTFLGKTHTDETKKIISQKKSGRKRPDVAERNRALKTKHI